MRIRLQYQLRKSLRPAVFGQTVRGVVHDLRTRLQPLLITTELANSAKDQASKMKAAQRLIDCATEILPKIRSLLDQALDAARGVHVEKKSKNLKDTIDSAIVSVRDLADRSNVEIKLDLQPMLDISHDGNHLERAITNILKNSIESIVENATASARVVRLALCQQGDSVSLLVEDSGKGYSDYTIRAKERGLRINQSTKHHGLGIGLSSAQQIVEAHGGELRLGKSTSLGGASSEILLPSKEPGL